MTYAEVQALLDASIGGAEAEIGAHRAFWRGIARDQFVTKRVFGKTVVVPGDSGSSNLIKALRGEDPFGSDIGTPGATIARMPARMDPMPACDIDSIAAWIDAGCPE